MNMIRINIQVFSILRDTLPPEIKEKRILQLADGADLNVLMDTLELKRKVSISVNGNHINDGTYRLHEDDEVKIFSSISGG